MLLVVCTPSPPPSPSPSPLTVTLTAATPSARLALQPQGARVLELTVRAINNPAQQSFAIGVVLEVTTTAGSRSSDLGLATPFPPDQPGVFLLAVPDAARTALASARTAFARVEIGPVSTTEPLDPRIAIVINARLLDQPAP